VLGRSTEAGPLRSTIGSQMHAVLVRMGVIGGFSAVVIEDARHRAVGVASGPGGRAARAGFSPEIDIGRHRL
jgi:hypothetical protein